MEDSISFTCPACGAKFKAPVTAAGRSAPCNHCGREVSVPAVFEDALSDEAPPPPLPQVFDAPRPHKLEAPPSYHQKQNIFVQMFLLLIALAIMGGGIGVVYYTYKNGHFPWVDAPASEKPTLPGKTTPGTKPAAPKPASPTR